MAELEYHDCVMSVEAIPMTNKSYASVKKPIPDTSAARR